MNQVVDILNELLAIEQENLVPRLVESVVFVSNLATGGLSAITRMAEASLGNAEQLAGQIERLGGRPGLRARDAGTGDLHFLELQSALPRLIADRERLIGKYALASGRLGGAPEASRVVSQILQRHRDELVELHQLTGGNVSLAD